MKIGGSGFAGKFYDLTVNGIKYELDEEVSSYFDKSISPIMASGYTISKSDNFLDVPLSGNIPVNTKLTNGRLRIGFEFRVTKFDKELIYLFQVRKQENSVLVFLKGFPN